MGGQICVDVGVVRCHFCSSVQTPTRCVTLHSLALAQPEPGSGSKQGSSKFGVTGAAASVGAAGNAARSTAASVVATGKTGGAAAASAAETQTAPHSSAVPNRAAMSLLTSADEPDDELDADGCGSHLGHSSATVPRVCLNDLAGGLVAGLDWTGGWTGGPTGRGWTAAFGGSAASVAAFAKPQTSGWQGHAKPICASLQRLSRCMTFPYCSS